MLKYAWITDTHLDFIDTPDQIERFAQEIIDVQPSGVIITGDISTGTSVVRHLKMLEEHLKRQIIFVLGNHDFYNSSLEEKRKEVTNVAAASEYLKYASAQGYIPLSENTALVGHDTWYDGLNGNENSMFILNDWCMIWDFVKNSGGYAYLSAVHNVKDRAGLLAQFRSIANEGVRHIYTGIKAAVKNKFTNIIVVSHVPPFPESHIYKGKIGDSEAQPWFTCRQLGDMLKDAAKSFPNVKFTSLSGHTHGAYEGKFANNLHVRVGGAEYKRPSIAGMLEIE